MADEASTSIPPWLVVVALAGPAGIGSFLGGGGLDNKPSERLANIESSIQQLNRRTDEIRSKINDIDKLIESCKSKGSRLEWRVEQCEKLLK